MSLSRRIKTCSKCNQVKNIEEFYAAAKANDGHHWWCKNCCKRNSMLNTMRRKGILTFSGDTESILAAQGGVCAICGEVPKRAALDHDHKSGEVRGVLCSPCNSGMGMFRDRPLNLEKAAIYLRRRTRETGVKCE